VRQIADRRQDDTDKDHDQGTKPYNDTIDARFEAQLLLTHLRSDCGNFAPECRFDLIDAGFETFDIGFERSFEVVQILRCGDVVVYRVEDFGRDPLGLLAVDAGVGQREPIRHRRRITRRRRPGSIAGTRPCGRV
jgi:hypothetical protein